MPIIRGILGPHTFEDVPYHTHEFDEISGKLTVTEADITSLSASKITTGSIEATTITLGAGGVIKSSDFVTGPGGSGFQISTGLAEFNNVTVRGALISGAGSSVDWTYLTNISVTNADIVNLDAEKINAGTLDSGVINTGTLSATQITSGTMSADYISGGSISGDLISGGIINGTTINAGTITTGTLNADNITLTNVGGSSIKDNAITQDHINVTSLSAITINTGALTVTGRIELGTSGVFASSDSSDPRIEILSTATDRIQWITTLANETAPARIRAVEHVSNYPQLEIYGPNGNTSIDMYSGTGSARWMNIYAGDHVNIVGSTGYVYVGPSNVEIGDVLTVANEVRVSNGSVTDPSYAFTNYETTGMYIYNTTPTLGFTTGGGFRLIFNSTEMIPTVPIRMNTNGSLSAPAYSWNQDNNTGLYHTGTDGYFAASSDGQIVQQWGSSGTTKEIYLYGLASSEQNPVHYHGTSGLLSYFSSTRRIKKNERVLEVGLTDRLTPKRFQYRRDDEITAKGMRVVEDDWEKEAIGFIAEDVAKAIPEAGIYDGERKTPMNYSDKAVLAATVTDLQDARKRIAELEQKVEAVLAAA